MIQIGNLKIPAGGSTSIQVKRWADGALCPLEVDRLIGLGVVGPKTVKAKTLLKLVLEKAPVRQWLQRSLHWLPQDFLEKFQLEGVERQLRLTGDDN